MSRRVRVKKEDSVIVISGKARDVTKPRRVLQVLPREERVLVEGVNVVKRHTRPNPQKNIKGGIMEREQLFHISNVMLVDPETKKPTRVGRKVLEDGKKVRFARRSGELLDK